MPALTRSNARWAAAGASAVISPTPSQPENTNRTCIDGVQKRKFVMKPIRILCLVFSLATLLAPAAHAQFAVFDATNYATALQEFGQLEQMYTTAVETRDQIVSAYNLAYQMSQMPPDMAMRYASQFSSWTDLAAPDAYGNTAAWIDALNLGGQTQALAAYMNSVLQAQPYPASALAMQDTNTQSVIQNQVGTSELAQGTTTGTLATLGTIRSNSQALAQKLANLEADTYSTDPTQQSEMAVLGKINTATLLQIHSQQDTNQILAASVQQQLVAQKQQIDAQNRAINEAIYFQQNFPNTMQQITGGVSDSIHAISLSPNGH